ncbi:FUSC family protein [Enterobacter bugandensis]|uniref:FUSC family protein n=1 Tax=Enterobacter bugandensis TaxID=881260 RepID=UPI002003953B|nr:FUSC family protein [Enterobacter bugandensis]MCK6964528.1 FUSC family protein [Enterobacter bugandensis]
MTGSISRGGKSPDLLRFLRQELRGFPGRYNTMLRYLLSSVIVIVISLSLGIPQIAYSLLVVFFATQKNIVLTRMIFPLFLLVNTVAVGAAILILKLTIDLPMLRLLSVSVALLILLYLMRSSRKWGFLYFAVAITITYAQSFVDLSSDGEMLLRNCLWSWVAGCYATVVAHIVNTLFLPVEPERQLQQETGRILTETIDALEAVAAEKPVPAISLEVIQTRVLTLHSCLKFSVMRSEKFRKHKERHLAEIATVERLYTASRQLGSLNGKQTASTLSHCHKLVAECRTFLVCLRENREYIPGQQEPSDDETLPVCLQEMYSALRSLSLLDEHISETTQPTEQDSGTSRTQPVISYDYVKYGIKTLLAVAICYIFYTSVQWPGIHTSMLTCIIVAVPGLGASVQKCMLRIGGCLIGSLMALFCTIFILPHIDSLTGLLLMVIPAVALSGWVTAGSERSSYAGIQILFAFSLAMFATFSPHPDLSEIRDRLIGIVLGITVSTVIHSVIWPETEGRTLRRSLAGLFEYLAARMSPMVCRPHTQAEGWLKLDITQKLLAQVALEPNWRSSDNEVLTLTCQTLLGKLREIHVALYSLETEYVQTMRDSYQSGTHTLVSHIMDNLSEEMKRYAQGLQSEPACSPSPVCQLNQVTKDILENAHENAAERDNSLLLKTEELITLCRSVPAWLDKV